MPEIVETEPARVVWADDPCLHCCRTEIVFHQHVGGSWLSASQSKAWEDPVFEMRVGGADLPRLHELRKQIVHWHGSLRRLALRLSYPSARPGTPHMDERSVEVHIQPLQAQALGDAQARTGSKQRQGSFRLRQIDQNREGLFGA